MSKAAGTRLLILQKSFELIYKKGYKSTSIDDILGTMRVTKGAFFYHFKNKEDMGLATINEVMYPGMHKTLIEPLNNSRDPVAEIYLMMETLLTKNPFFLVKYGCPAINLIEEMSSVSEPFNTALSGITNEWRDAIEASLMNGKSDGKIRKDLNEREVSLFIMSGYGGIRNLGKLYGKECYSSYLKGFKNYLKSLE